MFKNKTKLIILFYISCQYFFEIVEVSCSRPAKSKNSVNTRKDDTDAESRVWKDQWKEQSKWQTQDAEPLIQVVRGKSKEWTNLGEKHAQPLKRSDDSGFPKGPLTNDVGQLNLSDPVSKYHCPINLLYGNNLTVKNYFLLVPKTNESCDDQLHHLQTKNEQFENSLDKNNGVAVDQIGAMPPDQVPSQAVQAQGISLQPAEAQTNGAQAAYIGVSLMTGTVAPGSEETAALNASANAAVSGAENATSGSDNSTFGSDNSTFGSDNSTSGSYNLTAGASGNNTEGEQAVGDQGINATTTEISVTFIGEMENKTLEVMVEMFTTTESPLPTVETTSAPPNTNATPINNLSDDFMRTIDKYCETFNLTDQKAYTINPVSINTYVGVAEDRNKQAVVEALKHKRAPDAGVANVSESCTQFKWRGDQNYTIQPVVIPDDRLELSPPDKSEEVKKKKRFLTSKRPKIRTKRQIKLRNLNV